MMRQSQNEMMGARDRFDTFSNHGAGPGKDDEFLTLDMETPPPLHTRNSIISQPGGGQRDGRE